MWFKNLKLYRFTKPFTINTAELNELLMRMPFHDCGAQEIQSMGFVPLLKESELLFHTNNANVGFCLQIEQRILPANVINTELGAITDKIELETGMPVSKKKQKELKEDVIQKLLPRAFTKTRQIRAIFLQEAQVLAVDAGSDSQAETLLACLRKCLESLPVVPFVDSAQNALLTSWVMQESPDSLQVLNELELISTGDESAVIKVKNHDLQSDEVISHIKSGQLVEKIAISFEGLFTGIINAGFDIKRIKYASELTDENQDIPKDQKSARLDADFVLFANALEQATNTLRSFTKELS